MSARAEGCRSQIQALRQPLDEQAFAQKLGQLLTVERLCDAAAEGEFADLGVTESEALALIVNAVQAYLSRADEHAHAVVDAPDPAQASGPTSKRRKLVTRGALPARRK
jgi:hypothetical protein